MEETKDEEESEEVLMKPQERLEFKDSGGVFTHAIPLPRIRKPDDLSGL